MNQKQLLRPVADAAALAAPLANYNTADAVEFLNTLELARAAETLAALPLPRAVKMLEAPELHRSGGLLHPIEEQRAGVGQLRPSDGSGAVRPCPPEQLLLQGRAAERGAIHRDERSLGTLAPGVNLLGDQLLAGTGLALDHHRRVARGDGLDQVVDGLHGAVGAHHAAVARPPTRTGAATAQHGEIVHGQISVRS